MFDRIVAAFGIVVGGHSHSSPMTTMTSDEPQPILRYYLPLLILLAVFWPILLTLVAASISASAWLFWLCVGAAFGVLQLAYVLYNFAMIVWDVSALTLLKTFAMLRSVARHSYFKLVRVGPPRGGGGRGGRNNNSVGASNRGRREWREELNCASDYEGYLRIELLEPSSRRAGGRATAMSAGSSSSSTSSPSPAGTKLPLGLRFRKRAVAAAADLIAPSWSSSSSSSTRGAAIASCSPGSPVRKIQSSRDFNEIARAAGGDGPRRRGLRRVSSEVRDDDDVDDREGPASSSRGSLRRVSTGTLQLDVVDGGGDDASNDDAEWKRVVREDMGTSGDMLLTTLARLREARAQASSSANANDLRIDDPAGGNNNGEDHTSSLKTLLSGIVKRNHLAVDDFLMEDARSVAERGQHSLSRATRETIDRYGEEVERCIEWVASGAVYLGRGDDVSEATKSQANGNNRANNTPEQIMQRQRDELSKRYTLFKRMKQNMGHTALMLSGGGAQAMYHLGTIKALAESKLYEHIHVISGTSGGSIVAAMCAIKSPDELLRDICVNTVSTDYMRTGEMKRLGVSWFPSLYRMGANWMKSGLVMDSKEFFRCCEFYYSDITFEEAYEMTGKHVCITVSASRAYAGSGVQRLLLNHISTPNVTLSSAVAASCALPGVMSPTKLMIKDGKGGQMPFEVDGVEWIDGSVQADLPFKRISTLFNISNFVVAQTNFHVVPFLNKAHHPNVTTLYWKLFQMCMWDVKSRVLNLSQLGLFPKIFGQDLSKVFTQKYYGKLTLVPRFTTLQIFGLKVLSNPTVQDMDNYLQNGQLAAWPFLRVLKEMLRIERSIDAGLAKLDKRLKSVASGFGSTLPNDDVDSLSSANYRARLPGLGREAELLKVEVRSLRQENKHLRQQVARLQRSMGISHAAVGSTLEGLLVSVSTVEEAVK